MFDHCNSHSFKKINSFIFLFGNSLSIETFSLLTFTFNKYSFLKVRTTEIMSSSNNLEDSFQINSSIYNTSQLSDSDMCLLLSVNTRYEGTSLNLRLKSRYFKCDFLILSIGSLLDLTFPIFAIGSSAGVFQLIVGGNHLYSQIIKTANNPIVITNSEYSRRLDTNNISILLEVFKSYTYLMLGNWNGFNVLNSSINDVGILSVSSAATIKTEDLKNSSAFYLINTPLYTSNIKTLLELKILNFFMIPKPWWVFTIYPKKYPQKFCLINLLLYKITYG